MKIKEFIKGCFALPKEHRDDVSEGAKFAPKSKRFRRKVLRLRFTPLRTKKITVLKKNLAGEVTWQYEGVVLHREENAVTLEASFNRDDLPFLDVVLKRNDRFVETFYSDKWYNVFEIYDRDDKQLKGHYCNIGRPAVIEDGVVSYVDLALDLWVSADGKQTVLDEDEFEEMNFDRELRTQAYTALEELKKRFKQNDPPK